MDTSAAHGKGRIIGRLAAVGCTQSDAKLPPSLLALHKAVQMQSLLQAACFDEEDRRLAQRHTLLALQKHAESVRELDLTKAIQRRALLSAASTHGLLPADSELFRALVQKQVHMEADLP